MKKFLVKLLSVISAAVLSLSLVACNGNGDKNAYHVYMPDGAPAVALAEFLDGGYAGADFTVVNATTINARVSSGAADLAIMPINAAATLYNNGTKITMLSVNTHGNLYIVGAGEDIELSALVGKRLGMIGQGNVPDLTLRMLLGELDIAFEVSSEAQPEAVEGKITLCYPPAGMAPVAMLGAGYVDYAMLAEPAVTTATTNLAAKGVKIVADIQEIWRDTFESDYPQACLVAKQSIVQNDKAFIDKFLTDLSAADGWAAQNPEKTLAALAANYESGSQSELKLLNKDIVERCNIKTVAAATAKAECETYFGKLMTLKNALGNPVLAKLPDDGFYYKA